MKASAAWPSVLRGPVIHLEYPSLDAITTAMVRLQEFYESPLPGIKGNVFTLDEYKRVNADANDGVYLYDWTGFNIPGDVVREFFDRFETLTDDEREIKEHVLPPTGDFYLIATITDDPDKDIVAHEMCHAFFYLSDTFRVGMTKLVEKFERENPTAHAALHEWLIKRGYCEAVVIDEMQAYMATTPKDWWTEPDQGMSAESAQVLWDHGVLFRALVFK